MIREACPPGRGELCNTSGFPRTTHLRRADLGTRRETLTELPSNHPLRVGVSEEISDLSSLDGLICRVVDKDETFRLLTELFETFGVRGIRSNWWPLEVGEVFKDRRGFAGTSVWYKDVLDLESELRGRGVTTSGTAFYIMILYNDVGAEAVELTYESAARLWPALNLSESLLVFDYSKSWIALGSDEEENLGVWIST